MTILTIADTFYGRGISRDKKFSQSIAEITEQLRHVMQPNEVVVGGLKRQVAKSVGFNTDIAVLPRKFYSCFLKCENFAKDEF